MPTFDTPEPITVVIDLSVGDVRITASDRADTVVEVRPTDNPATRRPRRRADPGRAYPATACLIRRPGRAASACSAGRARST